MDTASTPPPGSEPLQFSLRGVFIATTAVCVMLAPAHWLGGLYAFLAILSLALVGCCTFFYWTGHRGISLILSLAAIVVTFLLFNSLILVHSVFNYFGCWICGAMRVRPRTYGVTLAILAAAAYSICLIPDAATLAEIVELRQQYAFRSLRNRLAFEKKNDLDENVVPVSLNPVVLKNLDEMEDREWQDGQGRVRGLRVLHERSLAEFMAATDFGVSRMARFSPDWLESEPRRNVRLPLQLAGVSETNPSQLAAVHDSASRDFLNPDRIGYVRSREAVAGFNSHGFTNLEEKLGGNKSSAWQLDRLELVSLLRHDEPRVYVAETLPQMDELEEVPHRALNEFESQSLSKLHYDEDLVIDSSADRIVMLGAVRAGNDCLQCHEGTRGKLLGAFSYELERVK